MRDFLKAKIEKNAVPQSDEDQKKKIFSLVSSVAIAHTIVVHKVHLDPDDYARLFFSLILHSDPKEADVILHSDPKEQTCTAFERLLKHFPSDQWQ